jgi:type II secretory pathway pseudopilin PulG
MELLVVIALMALLAAILFPVLSRARDMARLTACVSNLRQIAAAHQMYVQDHDDMLPSWQIPGPGGPIIWTEFLRPYYRDPRLLDEGLTSRREKRQFTWLADYALCAWGPAGNGTREKPHWRWPGALWHDAEGPRPMRLAEVRRPGETLQFTDGLTVHYGGPYYNSFIRRRHSSGILNGAYLDGRAGRISDEEWNRIKRDERGYFYVIAAADR